MSENKSKGLGDSIKKITEALGIPQCESCKERQEFFNKLIPYSQKISQEDIQYINSLLEQEPLKVYAEKLQTRVLQLGGPSSGNCLCTLSQRKLYFHEVENWLKSIQ